MAITSIYKLSILPRRSDKTCRCVAREYDKKIKIFDFSMSFGFQIEIVKQPLKSLIFKFRLQPVPSIHV